MFDIDSGKLLIVAVLALIVIGPKELPRVLRQVGQAVGKVRRMAGEFQGQFMDAMKEADIADIRKELDDLNKSTALDVHFDPARDIQAELTSAMASPSAAVVSETPVASHVEELGLIPRDIDPAEQPGVQHDAEPFEPPHDALSVTHLNGHAASSIVVPSKRKIHVKRRASSFHVMRAATGEPLPARRRTVRAKIIEAHDRQDA